MKAVGALVTLAFLILPGCAPAVDPDETSIAEDMERYRAEDEAIAAIRADSEKERGGESYTEFDERRDGYSGSRGSFDGVGCTVDCGGHAAGYAWAERKGITDPDQCGGKSWSFEEGCRAYAGEQ